MRILLTAMVAGAITASGPAQADDADMRSAVIQMLADVTLIDVECHDLITSFGPAFQASEALGFPPSDIMPTGRHRAEFEAAMRERQADMPVADLCGELARHYAADLPGTVKQQ